MSLDHPTAVCRLAWAAAQLLLHCAMVAVPEAGSLELKKPKLQCISVLSVGLHPNAVHKQGPELNIYHRV